MPYLACRAILFEYFWNLFGLPNCQLVFFLWWRKRVKKNIFPSHNYIIWGRWRQSWPIIIIISIVSNARIALLSTGDLAPVSFGTDSSPSPARLILIAISTYQRKKKIFLLSKIKKWKKKLFFFSWNLTSILRIIMEFGSPLTPTYIILYN